MVPAAKDGSWRKALGSFWINDREPFLLGTLTESGLCTEEVVQLLLVLEP
jgi:hypothetical protein